MKKYEILARDDRVISVIGIEIKHTVNNRKFDFILHQSPYDPAKTSITELSTRRRLCDVDSPCILANNLHILAKTAINNFVDQMGAMLFIQRFACALPFDANDEEL